MAYFFELWAECDGRHACEALVQHFNGLTFDLHTGKRIHCQASLVGATPDAQGVSVWAPELSRFGVRSVADALETTEAGLRLYKHLTIAPPFRFARVAWEPGNIPSCDLLDYLKPFFQTKRFLSLECVMDEPLYRDLGSPSFCYPFRPGYWWTRYRGEEYRPLYACDQDELNGLCRQLFPEYFSY